MLNILLTVLFALGLVTSGGITVAASQNAAPDDLLFPVRVWSEDARLAVADDETEAELALTFAEKYMEQMTRELANKGEISGPFVNRFAEMFAHANAHRSGVDLENGNGTYNFQNILPKKNNENTEPAGPKTEGSQGTGQTDQTEDRLQTLVDTVQTLTVEGIIDPVGVMIQQHDRDRVNDNANQDQPRNMYQLAMPGTDTDGDGIIDPVLQGNGAGTPCALDVDLDGVEDTTAYYCYLVYHPTEGGWYWYYGTDPYSAEGAQPAPVHPRFPTIDLGPGPGPGSSNGSGGTKK